MSTWTALAFATLVLVFGCLSLSTGADWLLEKNARASTAMLADKRPPKPRPDPPPPPPPPEPKPKRPPDPMAGTVETYICPPAPAGLSFPDCWTAR